MSTEEFLPWGQSSQGTKLTIHLHLQLRLRMSGATPQLPICALIMWTGTTSPSIPTTGQDHNYSLICYDKYMLFPLTLLTYRFPSTALLYTIFPHLVSPQCYKSPLLSDTHHHQYLMFKGILFLPYLAHTWKIYCISSPTFPSSLQTSDMPKRCGRIIQDRYL